VARLRRLSRIQANAFRGPAVPHLRTTPASALRSSPFLTPIFSTVPCSRRSRVHDANQSNHALALASASPWVLFMDCDYMVTAAAREELAALRPSEHIVGYWSRFRYQLRGRLLRGALYPPRICLFRPSAGRYYQKGHTQMLDIMGPVGQLAAPLIHDDRKPESEFVARQRRYAALEARHLSSVRFGNLSWSQRVRRLMVIAPWLVPLYALLVRDTGFDGVAGWRYAWERAIAEQLIARELWRITFSRGSAA